MRQPMPFLFMGGECKPDAGGRNGRRLPVLGFAMKRAQQIKPGLFTREEGLGEAGIRRRSPDSVNELLQVVEGGAEVEKDVGGGE